MHCAWHFKGELWFAIWISELQCTGSNLQDCNSAKDVCWLKITFQGHFCCLLIKKDISDTAVWLGRIAADGGPGWVLMKKSLFILDPSSTTLTGSGLVIEITVISQIINTFLTLSRQHYCLSIGCHFGWVWQILNLRQAGLSNIVLKLLVFNKSSLAFQHCLIVVFLCYFGKSSS